MHSPAYAANLALLVATLAASSSPDGQDDTSRVAIVLHSKPLYQQAAASLTARLDELHVPYDLFDVPRTDCEEADRVFRRVRGGHYAVIATSGSGLTQRALHEVPEVPVVFFGVPNALDAEFLGQQKARRISGVTTDVRPEEQVRWIRTTDPNAQRVAILHSDRTPQTVAALVAAGRRLGLTFVPIAARREAFPDAIEALSRAKVEGVLMIPDAGVYNSPNVQRLLIWGARARKPIWAFSVQVVKAGAFAGIFSSISDAGRQAADLIVQVRDGRLPPSEVLYPRALERAVNYATARTIGHSLNPDVVQAGTLRFGVP